MAARARRAHGSVLSATDRALGALYGLAIGDALGMPTQGLDPARARDVIGSPADFRDAPLDQAIARGLPAGSITDDTMQCMLVARLLIEGDGVIAPRALAEALLEWEREMVRRGRTDLLGPSSRRALAALAAGADPSRTGRGGTTNGAAMRIAPVGIVKPPDTLLEAVIAANRVTHDTPIAHAAAAVVATVVSAGVEGASFDAAAPLAIRAAGHFGFADLFEDPIPMRTGVEAMESVPTAFALARLAHGDAWKACSEAAALGGDTDTIGAIAGAMAGACSGLSTLPPDAVRKVREVNELEFEPIANRLLELRYR